jgi:AcrR family transcriptional regulator
VDDLRRVSRPPRTPAQADLATRIAGSPGTYVSFRGADDGRAIDNVTKMTDPQRSDRHARRREQTRLKLLDAARVLFARQGVENTRINEITEAADVGFGSFYNHFESKEAIAAAVLADVVAAQGAVIDVITSALEDPAEIISAAHRHFVRLARSDPDWAWLLIRMDVSHDIVLGALGPFAERDLRRGIASGRLQVDDERTALVASGGALLGVMRAVLDGRAPQDADVHHASGILRLFGVTAQEAAEVARRSLAPGPASHAV